MRIITLVLVITSVVHAALDLDQGNDPLRFSTGARSSLHHQRSHHRQQPTASTKRSTHSGEADTVIENKNVNIVVNLDPKDVAEELWRIIETRNPQSRRSPSSGYVIQELESAITPVVSPTRRSQPSPRELANSLDGITRKALRTAPSSRTPYEEEIITREIVNQMMGALSNMKNKPESNYGISGARRSLSLKSKKQTDEETIDLLITVSRRKLREALRSHV